LTKTPDARPPVLWRGGNQVNTVVARFRPFRRRRSCL